MRVCGRCDVLCLYKASGYEIAKSAVERVEAERRRMICIVVYLGLSVW